MKRNHLLIVSLLLVLVAACAPGDGSVCDNGLCIRGEVTEPKRLGEPASLVVTVESDQAVDGIVVSIDHSGSRAPIKFDHVPPEAHLINQSNLGSYWSLRAEAGREYAFTGQIELPPPDSPSGVDKYGFVFSAHHLTAHAAQSVNLYLDAAGNRLEPAEARSRMGEVPIAPTIHPSITPVIPTPYPTINWPTATPEPTPTVDPYPAPGEGLNAPPPVDDNERAMPTVAAYPAP